MNTDRKPGIAAFYLYGETPREVANDFLHLEDLSERSRPSNWTIQPHAHAALAHVFLITAGGGSIAADGISLYVDAPAMVLIPAGVVHAFAWHAETQGSVLTISNVYLARLLAGAPELVGLFDAPANIALPPTSADIGAIGHTLERIGRELARPTRGHVLALEVYLITVLLDAWRHSHFTKPPGGRPTRHARARLAQSFMAAVERDFRNTHRLAGYAGALGTRSAALRDAVRATTGQPPVAVLRDRQVLEAKRLLRYTNVSVAEVAYTLGFKDPAYFSRVFRSCTGVPPRKFRLAPVDG